MWWMTPSIIEAGFQQQVRRPPHRADSQRSPYVSHPRLLAANARSQILRSRQCALSRAFYVRACPGQGSPPEAVTAPSFDVTLDTVFDTAVCTEGSVESGSLLMRRSHGAADHLALVGMVG